MIHIALVSCIVFLGLFIAAFWVRRGSIPLRVLSQLTTALLFIIAAIVFLEALGYSAFPLFDKIANAAFLVMMGALLVSGVVFMVLSTTGLFLAVRGRCWGHAVVVLVLGALPYVLFAWIMSAHGEYALQLLLSMPPLMLPLLVYGMFFAPSRDARAPLLGLRARLSTE